MDANSIAVWFGQVLGLLPVWLFWPAFLILVIFLMFLWLLYADPTLFYSDSNNVIDKFFRRKKDERKKRN